MLQHNVFHQQTKNMTHASTNTTIQLTHHHAQKTDNHHYLYDRLQKIDALTQSQKPWSAATFCSLLSNTHHHLLYVTKQHMQATTKTSANSVMVGFCLYQQLFESAEILRIATHPHYQRQGIGKQMLMALFDTLTQQQAQHILLEVRADNVAAIALYQQHGFVQIDIRKGYYSPKAHSEHELQPQVDALIMQKIL